MESTKALLLVCEPELRDRIRVPAARRARREIEIQHFTGPAERAAIAARLAHGGDPLGCLVAGEDDVNGALRGGADEAIVCQDLSESSINSFIDRMMVRADVRRAHERRQGTSLHAEKLAALGTLVAGVGHEINNPLTALSLSVEAARRSVQPLLHASWELRRLAATGQAVPAERIAELLGRLPGAARTDPSRLLDEMASASRSIADVVRDLRVFARSDDHEEATVVDLMEVVEQVLRMVGPEVTRYAVIERDYARDLSKLAIPRNRIAQVVMNIIVNAGHAVREVERPMHRVRISARADEDFVALSISDSGPGIPDDSLERIFDPFFTTKRETMGTGLGLSISRSILRGVGGDLIVESIFGEGATFVCLLPLPTRDELVKAHRNSIPAPGSTKPPPSIALLVVDEDERVLRACARYLSEGCRIVLARDGREAIELLESGSEVDAVLTELTLPEVDGPALHAWLREHRPELAERTLLMCDRLALDPTQQAFIEDYRLPMVEKPLSADALTERIHGLFKHAAEGVAQDPQASV